MGRRASSTGRILSGLPLSDSRVRFVRRSISGGSVVSRLSCAQRPPPASRAAGGLQRAALGARAAATREGRCAAPEGRDVSA